MDISPMSPMSPMSPHHPFSTDKELANLPEKESTPCDPVHFCRQCNTNWSGIGPVITSTELLNTSSNEAIPRPAFRKRCIDRYGKHPRLHWILLSVLVLIVAIAVVLAIRFRPRHSNPTGIYRNGTGLVVLDRGDDSTTVDVFFQHESGQIRHSVYNSTSTQWSLGRPEDNVLGEDAPSPRRGTPLMAVSYKIGDETTWRVFYVDSSDFLQESISSTRNGSFPSMWSSGTLRLGKFMAHSSPHTGLSVCTNMMWSPDAAGFNNGSLVLFYGAADGENHMLTHEVQDTTWKDNYTFRGSSAASGIECTNRRDEILDVWMVDIGCQLIQASFNFDSTSNNTIYQAGKWINGTVYGNSIEEPTSISAIKYTGSPSTYESNSTFIHFAEANIVKEINVDTSDRTRAPNLTQTSWNVSNLPIVSGSKIGSVALRTDRLNPHDGTFGKDSKIFLQVMSNPTQVSVVSGNFEDDGFRFDVNGSAILN